MKNGFKKYLIYKKEKNEFKDYFKFVKLLCIVGLY